MVLEDVVAATTPTNAKSVTAAAGPQVGRDENCAPDGGSQILTLGGIDIPADLKVFGGQMIAMKDIEFAANANGIAGASFISGARISGTWNRTMGFCGTGWERNFEAKYFHLRALGERFVDCDAHFRLKVRIWPPQVATRHSDMRRGTAL